RSNGQIAPTENLDDLPPYSANTPGGAGNKNRCVDRHGWESPYKGSPRGSLASRIAPTAWPVVVTFLYKLQRSDRSRSSRTSVSGTAKMLNAARLTGPNGESPFAPAKGRAFAERTPTLNADLRLDAFAISLGSSPCRAPADLRHTPVCYNPDGRRPNLLSRC